MDPPQPLSQNILIKSFFEKLNQSNYLELEKNYEEIFKIQEKKRMNYIRMDKS